MSAHRYPALAGKPARSPILLLGFSILAALVVGVPAGQTQEADMSQPEYGVIFEQEAATLTVPHTRQGITR